MSEVAREAAVSVGLVYKKFDSKLQLVNALYSEALGANDETSYAALRAKLDTFGEDARSGELISCYAHTLRTRHERVAVTACALRRAAHAGESDLVAFLRASEAHDLAAADHLCQLLRDRGAIAEDGSVPRYRDLVWLAALPEQYVSLVVDRAWNPSDYERWLVSTLSCWLSDLTSSG